MEEKKDARKVDLSAVFKNFENQDLVINGKPVTLGKTIAESLSVPLEEDKGIAADQVVSRWKLAMRCYDEGKHELSPEDRTLIRSRITKTHTMIIAAQVCEMLA